MSKHIESIYTPRFVGARFEEHRLPLEFLDDLQVLGKINTTIAKWLWREKNPLRQRIPRGFEKGINYTISGIKDGSAIPTVELVAPKNGMFPTDYAEYFQDAPKALTDAIQKLDDGEDPTSVLPEHILLMMESFGASLRSDEYVEFRPSETKTARYTVQNRKKLILQVSKNKQYSTDGVLRGTLSELDKKKSSFQFQLMNGKTVQGSFTEEFKSAFLDAFSEDDQGQRKHIGLYGSIVYNAADFPVAVQKVEELDILDPLDIGWRFEEIAQLKEGWYQGEGNEFSWDQLFKLATLFDERYSLQQLPYLYPTPDGSISAEWEYENYDISLEIDLDTLSGHLHSLNIESDETSEMVIDLSESEGWEQLNDYLNSKAHQG